MPCGHETADLSGACDRVLAAGLRAPRDIPSYNIALVDGYACRENRLQKGDAIEVAGRLGAGELWKGFLAVDQCLQVMTGAGLADDIDLVLPSEAADHSRAQTIVVERPPGRTTNIGKKGSYAKSGDLLIPGGVRLGAEELAIAAGCGRTSLPVHKRPRIGIVTTGSELVAPPSQPIGAQRFSTHGIYLSGLVKAEGGRAEPMGTVPDEEAALIDSIEKSMSAVDLLLTTGGTGPGSRDLLPRVMESLGGMCVFRGVGMRPGRTTSLYQIGKCPILALPGGIGGVSVAFEVLVRPAIRWMAGDRRIFPLRLECRATSPLTKMPAVHRFLESRIWIADGQICADPISRSLRAGGLPERRTQGWIELPPGQGVIPCGTPVKVRMKRCGLEAQAA
jgi:molybdopterin molybdotransferase